MDEFKDALEKLAKKRALREARERQKIREDLVRGLIDDHADDEPEAKSPPDSKCSMIWPRQRMRLAPFRYGILMGVPKTCAA
ncbi:hypothetical protein Q0601_18925 [Paracoccus onubensis]|uniref:hypothetical protein n=1 Tax=Paracoccus onubensis TaxID=1675788 RepID=UPI00272FDA05|nr:hypothetical protein [Paracoccus onubensis]MDP0929262.1 hypothetical protein [Paracoccus onubensis]